MKMIVGIAHFFELTTSSTKPGLLFIVFQIPKGTKLLLSDIISTLIDACPEKNPKIPFVLKQGQLLQTPKSDRTIKLLYFFLIP